MNSNKSVFWGFVSLSVAGFGAWYIERTKYMEEKRKKIEQVNIAKQKHNDEKNIKEDNSSYKPYDETNRKRVDNNSNNS